MDQGVSGRGVSRLELHGERSAMETFHGESPVLESKTRAHLKHPEDAPWKA